MFKGSVFILRYQNEVTISDLKIELPIQIYQVINSFSLIESQKVKIDVLIIVFHADQISMCLDQRLN